MTVIVPTATREAQKFGGDPTVERDGHGRPRIIVGCNTCDGSGTVASPKTGKQIKCQACKGAGEDRKVSYSRVTTYIDVLESKDAIATWKARKVLQGVAIDPTLLDKVLEYDDSEREGRDWLNRTAEIAADKGGASTGSSRGDLLHDYSEIVDLGNKLPKSADEQDIEYMKAYWRATKDLMTYEHIERLTVNDFLQVAGTPDRVGSPKINLTAPDGTVITPEDKIITDLKTGRVDYGMLKMAMQLSIYSRSLLYTPDGLRTAIPGLRTDWGLIMHLPQVPDDVEPVLHLLWADLNLGWEAVLLAGEVRKMRARQKGALTPMVLS